MLEKIPNSRPSARECLDHAWFIKSESLENSEISVPSS